MKALPDVDSIEKEAHQLDINMTNEDKKDLTVLEREIMGA